MKAAIYARYSSDQQRDASIEDQVRLCRERLDREGWTLVQTYADRALSGSTMLRPGLQALLEDAMAARFDVIVSEALDRISRDQADVAGIFKRLKFAGIPLVTLAEGEITDLHVGLKGTMNALFLKDLAAKTHRGLRGRVEAGRSGGGNCYGYDVVHQPAGNGEIERGLHRLMEPDLFKAFVEGFIAELNKLQAEHLAEARTLRAELDRLPVQIDKLVMAIADGADARRLNSKIKELEARQDELDAHLAALPRTDAPLLHPNLATLYRDKVAALREVLGQGADRDRAMELIRSLIEEVRLTPAGGTLHVELRGELAGILELCGNGNKKPGTLSGTGLSQQIKLVAGAGYNLYRTVFRWT